MYRRIVELVELRKCYILTKLDPRLEHEANRGISSDMLRKGRQLLD